MLSYWSYGSLFYDTFPDKDPEDVKAYLALEDDYITNAALGFSIDKSAAPFDWDTVETALATIRDEKVKPIVFGYGDYDTEWSAVYEELKKAGYEEYCAEWIRQYNEWKAAN